MASFPASIHAFAAKTDGVDDILASHINDLQDEVMAIETYCHRWVYPLPPLTAATFDGDAFSTTAATTIDLSAVFAVPANVKAVLVRIEARDSVAWGTGGNYISVGPTTTYYYHAVCRVAGGDVLNSVTAVVPCDANGDIAYRIIASGAGTLDVWIWILGYTL